MTNKRRLQETTPPACARRSGNPLLALDLARVSVDVARAIVVLATAESPERSDARVLRIVLSLMGVHDRLKKAGRGGLQARPFQKCRTELPSNASLQSAAEQNHETLAWPHAYCVACSIQFVPICNGI
jgi:hypothetical protein